jgi:CheY-like chemotaxis protein
MKSSLNVGAKRSSVLIASPDRYFRLMIGEIVTGIGYDLIEQVASTRVLLETVARRSFTLLILDEDMTELTSSELSRMVRNANLSQRAPLIALVVSRATRTVVEDARNAGIEALITKPVIPLRLSKTLDYLWQIAAAA